MLSSSPFFPSVSFVLLSGCPAFSSYSFLLYLFLFIFFLACFQYLFPYLCFPLYTHSVLRPAVCSSSQHTSTTRSSHFLSSTETFLSRCRIWTNDPGMAAIESPSDRRRIVKMWPVMLEWVFGVLLSFLTCSSCKATLPQVIHDSIRTTLSMHYWRRLCVRRRLTTFCMLCLVLGSAVRHACS